MATPIHVKAANQYAGVMSADQCLMMADVLRDAASLEHDFSMAERSAEGYRYHRTRWADLLAGADYFGQIGGENKFLSDDA